MEGTADVRALQALSEHPRADDLARLAWSAMIRDGARAMPGAELPQDPGDSPTTPLPDGEAATAWGDAGALLTRTPRDADEQILARALSALALSRHPPRDGVEAAKTANLALYLSASTPYDALALVDKALPADAAGALWTEIAKRLRSDDAGKGKRAELLAGAAALASSRDATASRLVRELAQEQVPDPLVLRLLGRHAGPQAIRGELVACPRGPFAVVLRSLFGISLVAFLWRVVTKVALAYTRPAEIALAPEGVRVRWRVEVLGRTLREEDVLLPAAEIRRVSRDVRYGSLGLYVGLAALAVGSYVGLLTVADGLRAASTSLLLMGLAIVIAGLLVDFVLWSLWPGRHGVCRVWVVARHGRSLCVGGVEIQAADALLASLSQR